MKTTRIIAFEGIDGSGKGTQVTLIAERLKALGYKVTVKDFPAYDRFFGTEIGTLLSGECAARADEVDPKSMSLWYALDRWDVLKDFDASAYDFVLFNRSTLSNVVYQGVRVPEQERRDFALWVFELEFHQLKIPEPDVYFVFDISAGKSKENVQKKGKRDYLKGQYDVYEKSGNMIALARQEYRRLAEENPRIKRINCMDEQDGMKSLEEIAELVLGMILPA